jgi:hypothetical protein
MLFEWLRSLLLVYGAPLLFLLLGLSLILLTALMRVPNGRYLLLEQLFQLRNLGAINSERFSTHLTLTKSVSFYTPILTSTQHFASSSAKLLLLTLSIHFLFMRMLDEQQR